MIKKILSILFSTRLMALLFLSFAIAMGAGTFIESKYNTDTAKIWVYNAWWFEAIMVFFMINFIGNIKRYQLLKKERIISGCGAPLVTSPFNLSAIRIKLPSNGVWIVLVFPSILMFIAPSVYLFNENNTL